MTNLKVGKKYTVTGGSRSLVGDDVVTLKEIAPTGYISHEIGATVLTETGSQWWVYQKDLVPYKEPRKKTTRTKGLKNKVEVKDDIALISINSEGIEKIVIVDKIDIPRLEVICTNRLNIDTGGHVQHRKVVDGKYEVHQLHRLLTWADENQSVTFKNGNKLDLRFSNLLISSK